MATSVGDVLSQSEIDDLLNKMETGEVEPEIEENKSLDKLFFSPYTKRSIRVDLADSDLVRVFCMNDVFYSVGVMRRCPALRCKFKDLF